jgi:hypothetical protein
MSDHQDRVKNLPDRGGRLERYPRSDLEHAAKQLLKQCDDALLDNMNLNLKLAMDNLRKVMGEDKL